MTAADTLALALAFTLPTMTTPANGCAAGPHALRSDSLSWAVYERHQSPTWVGMAAAMKALPEVWAAYWPRVRAEAEPVRVASGKATPGEIVTVTPPACAVTCWWHVTSSNGRGESCPSNVVNE